MANQLRQRQGEGVALGKVYRHPSFPGRRQKVLHALIDVLVRERGRGIEAVHDRVGAVPVQQLEQQAAAQHRVGELAVEIFQQCCPARRVGRDGRPIELRQLGRQEHIAPSYLHRRRAQSQTPQLLRRPPHLGLAQRHQDQPRRMER